jgi:hypothetical protein
MPPRPGQATEVKGCNVGSASRNPDRTHLQFLDPPILVINHRTRMLFARGFFLLGRGKVRVRTKSGTGAQGVGQHANLQALQLTLEIVVLAAQARVFPLCNGAP